MTAPRSFPHIGVIADDCAGAVVAGARLRSSGLRTVVVARGGAWPEYAEAIVVNVGTREFEADATARPLGTDEVVAAASRKLVRELRCQRLELRIDGLLRRDYSAELAGLLAGARDGGMDLSRAIHLAVPAYPKAGRVTRSGEQVAVTACKEKDFNVAVAGRVFGDDPVTAIPVEVVDEGPDAIKGHVMQCLGATRRFLADSTRDDHLRTLARAVAEIERECPVVTLSSSGWLGFHPDRDGQRSFVLVALGLPTEPNEVQLAELCRTHSSLCLSVDDAANLQLDESNFANAVGAVDVVVIRADGAGESDRARLEAANLVACSASATLELSRRTGLACTGVVASGALTASRVASELGSESIAPSHEVRPLIALGHLTGGAWAGLPVVLKGGYVGDTQALVEVVREFRAPREAI